MSIFDLHTARVLATIGAVMAVVALLYGVRHTLIALLFAILFAYLLEPIVWRVEKSMMARGSRWLAILETYLAMLLLLTALGIFFGPRLVEDARLLSQSLPELLDKVTTGKIIWQFGGRYGWSYDTQSKIEQLIAAPKFYAVMAVAMVLGLMLDFLGFNAVKMLFWSAVINGLLAPPLILLVILLTSNSKVMGNRVNPPLLRYLGWATFAVMTAAAVGMIVTS